MEEGNIVVDDGSGSGKGEPSHPPRPWWLPAVSIIGVVVAGVVLVATQRSTEELPINTPEALPLQTTTTSAQPPATTTTAPTTTTTVWWGATDEAAEFQAVVQDVCERASLVGVDDIQPLDDWVESLFIDGEWMNYYLEEIVFFEAAQARNAQDERLVGLMESVRDDLEDVEDATDFVLHNTAPVGSDEWTHRVLLAEHQCAAAKATIATMVAAPATASTSAMWWDVTRPGNIESELQTLCLQASPADAETLKTIEESLESTYSPAWWSTYDRVSRRVDDAAYHPRLDQDIPLVNLLASVATDLDNVEAAVENAYRNNTDLDPQVWAYHALLIERHCASATATIATMVAIVNK